MKKKNYLDVRLFVFQKYGIFENISLGQFIKHKPLISDEECLINIQSEIKKNTYIILILCDI